METRFPRGDGFGKKAIPPRYHRLIITPKEGMIRPMKNARLMPVVVVFAAFFAIPMLSRAEEPPVIGIDKIAEILTTISYNNLWSRSPEGTYYSFYSAKNDASGQGYGFCKDAKSGKREALYLDIDEERQIVLTEVTSKAVLNKVKKTVDLDELKEESPVVRRDFAVNFKFVDPEKPPPFWKKGKILLLWRKEAEQLGFEVNGLDVLPAGTSVWLTTCYGFPAPTCDRFWRITLPEGFFKEKEKGLFWNPDPAYDATIREAFKR